MDRAEAGRRFCTLLDPPATSRGGVLILPPFAEEANKTRRACMEVGRACAAAGWTVLLGDLAASGDSEGDFATTGWQDWVADVAAFSACLRTETDGPLVVLGLRLGALLGAAAFDTGLVADGFFMLCPVSSGKQALTQFLRLGAAADLGAGDASKIDTRPLRASLAVGDTVEIAGYALSPAMANGIEACQIGADNTLPKRVAWLDFVSSDPPVATPAIEMLAAKLRGSGRTLDLRLVTGPAFWQTQEIELLPDLPRQVTSQLVSLLEGLT